MWKCIWMSAWVHVSVCVCCIGQKKGRRCPLLPFFPLYLEGINEQNKRKHIRPLPVSMLCLFQKVVRLWGGITESRTRFFVCKTRRGRGPKLSSAFLRVCLFSEGTRGESTHKVRRRYSLLKRTEKVQCTYTHYCPPCVRPDDYASPRTTKER